MTKRRISASIDPDLLSAAEAAVKRRGSSNFSASFRPNENKMSDGGRGRASLGVKMWKSSEM
jgi:hypothetical protein